MRKITLLSLLVLAAMVLAACGGEETTTTTAPTQPPITAVATEPATATEMPTEAATETPGVPVTGAVNPARVSNELEFSVVDQSGNQVGSVNDMILDLDTTTVAYVVVDAGGRSVAVPWENLQLQTSATGTGTGQATEAPTEAATEAATDTSGTSTTATAVPTEAGVATGEATAAATDTSGTGTGLSGQNAFVLLTDPAALDNAPAFDPSTLPPMGQSAAGWDAALLSYWQGAGTGTGQATQAPTDTSGTGTTGTATAAPTEAGVATGEATAAPTDTSGTGTQGIAALQGIALASDMIGSTITVGAATGTGTGTGQATEAPTEAATEAATDTSGTDTTGTATSAPDTSGTGTGTGMTGSMSGTVEDIIVDTDSGDILYVVLNTTDTTGAGRLIPVPVSLFQWDGTMQGLVLNVDSTMLQGAPTFQEGQFPDTSMSGWNSEIDSFWQSNGSGSGSGGADATATP